MMKRIVLFLCASLSVVAFNAAVADDPGTATYRDFVNDAIKQIGARTGVALKLPTVVKLETVQIYNDSHKKHAPIWGEGVVWLTSGETWSPDGACAIKIFPILQQSVDMQGARMVISHEVFHCFQDQVLGSYKAWKAVPGWLMEGEAQWVGESLYPSNNPDSRDAWKGYIENPNKHLFVREYDAVGFYAHLEDAGVDVWKILLPMVTQKSLVAYHTAVDKKPKEFLTTWAASWFRQGPSKEWRIDGPGPVPPGSPPSHLDAVANGQMLVVKAKAWENTLKRVDAQGADVVRFTPVTGWGAVTDYNNTLDVKLFNHSVEVCTKVGGCECPEGTTGSPPTLNGTAGPLKLGVTGGDTGASITVAGRPLDDYCKESPEQEGSWGNPCSVLDAATISRITGLHITKVRNLGESCLYVDPTAPLNPVVQQFAQALSMAFSGESPLRLKGAPGGMPQPQSGAGVIVRTPAGGDLTKFSVHDYVESILAEVPAEAACGSLHDVKGLNAASVVCLNGAIGHGGVVSDGRAVHVMYLAPGNATNDVMGRLLKAAAAHM